MKTTTTPKGKIYGAHVLLFAAILSLTFCTKKDQVIDQNPAAAITPVLNTSTLTSIHVNAGPALQPIGGAAWDGTIDAAWNSAPALTVQATVPDLGNGTFTGYVGNSTTVTMRSMYDATNIYYLIEWGQGQKNVKSAQWYFNPAMHLWTQEVTNYETPAASTTNKAGTNYNVNADGTIRPLFAQDQFVMMWNIANSCPKFAELSCYAACHVNSSYGNPNPPPEGGVMYTNGPSELLDVWRARMLQVANANQANDCFIDDGSSVGLGQSGTLNKNEVHGDWQINNGSSSSVPPALQSAQAADGGFNNKQTLTITGKSTKESVPIWVIPSGNYTNSAIMIKDTLSGVAVKVLAVDSMGVLTLANSTTIDPNTAASGLDYQQKGAGDGPKCIPGSIVDAYTGSRGDVTANAFYTGTGWRLMMKRALKTTDNVNDVDFSSLKDLDFGIGVMFNGADNQHAIVAGLKLKFQK